MVKERDDRGTLFNSDSGSPGGHPIEDKIQTHFSNALKVCSELSVCEGEAMSLPFCWLKLPEMEDVLPVLNAMINFALKIRDITILHLSNGKEGVFAEIK
ncbi:hypothetical protein ACH5RR_008365 [Cinchona calisaya]|uniref:Uncharacterized protein n=1 Tax=Cinchona calisaya TaxID=153742 RepID=A0ABD3AD25_9GENT